MTHFNELFLFRSADADESSRGERRGRFARTRFVPVTDAQSAARVASDLNKDGLDLIELFGGLGADVASAVVDATGGEVPVGLADIRSSEPVGARAVIFLAPDAAGDLDQERYVHRDHSGSMTIVAIPDAGESPATVERLIDEGVEQLTLCGAHGLVAADAVLQAVGDRIRIDAVLFGFDSLASVAAYQARYGRAVDAAG